jgi:hypothetical protein
MASGAALRAWQYLAAVSQHVDDLAMSRNIVCLSWSALAGGPLAFAQAAPKGFLLLAKAAAAIGGPGDLALRFVAFAGSLLALALFYRLARRLLREPAAVALALACFSTRPELIFYAAQVKPYACDLAAALGLTLLTFGAASGGLTWRRGALLGGAGAVAVFVSYGAVLVLAGLAATLGVIVLARAGRRAPPAAPAPGAKRRRSVAPLAAAVLPWAAASVAAVAWARASTPPLTAAYFQQFWAAAFAPSLGGAGAMGGVGGVGGVGAVARWLAQALSAEMPAAGLGPPWPAVYAGLALLGAVMLWRRHGTLSLLLWGPVASTAAAAEAHLYPFANRLVLFLVPALLLAAAAGIEGLGAAWRWMGLPKVPARSFLVFSLFAAPAGLELAHNRPIYRVEEMKPILREVAQRRRPGDAIYVYYGAGQAVRFYGPRYGLRPHDYVLGRCLRGEPRGYLRELDRFRGRSRVWVLVSHALPDLGEEPAMLAYLDLLGKRRLAVRALPQPRTSGFVAAALLYDLGSARGLPAAAASSFPVPPTPARLDLRFACVGPQNAVSPQFP